MAQRLRDFLSGANSEDLIRLTHIRQNGESELLYGGSIGHILLNENVSNPYHVLVGNKNIPQETRDIVRVSERFPFRHYLDSVVVFHRPRIYSGKLTYDVTLHLEG